MRSYFVYSEIYFSSQINIVLHYLSKIPIINRIVPQKLFGMYRTKKLFAVLGVAYGLLKMTLAANVGLFFTLFLIPGVVYKQPLENPMAYVFIFIMGNCLAPVIMECGLLTSKSSDYMFLYHFMMNPEKYYKYRVLTETLKKSILIFPALYYVLGNVWLSLFLVLCKAASILVSDALYLSYFKNRQKMPSEWLRKGVALLIAGAAYACVPFWKESQGSLILEAVAGLICVCGLISSGIYLYNYTNYKRVSVCFANPGVVSFHVSVDSNIGESDNGLEDSDWKENKAYFEKNRNLPAEIYMDKVFLHRFGKSIFKAYLYQFIFYVIIFGILGILIRKNVISLNGNSILDYSPILLSAITGFSFATRFSQMFFRNIDMHMMSLNMCSKEFIKKSMKKRLKAVLGCDIVLSLLMAGCSIVFQMVSGYSLGIGDNLKLTAASGIYLMIWEIYELAVYYFIQPYSVELTVKSPLFSALGVFDSVFSLIILLIRADITAAIPWLAGILILLLLLYWIGSNFAYKTFKLRY